jgi:hypothetical protein
MLERIGETVSNLYTTLVEEDHPWSEPSVRNGGPPIPTISSPPSTELVQGSWLFSNATAGRLPTEKSSFTPPSIPKQVLKGLSSKERAAQIARQKDYLRECIKGCLEPGLRVSLEHCLRTLGMDRMSAGPVLGWRNTDREIDCSGFVSTVYLNAGLPLAPTIEKAEGTGTERMASALPGLPEGCAPRTGDLVLFNTDEPAINGVNHVGILIVDAFGNTSVLQNTNSGVRLTSMEDVARDGGPTWRASIKCIRRPQFD